MAQQSSSSSSYSSYLYNLGASALKYGYNTVASYVSYDGGDLDVVDPNAEGSQNVTQMDANDKRQSFFLSSNFSKYVGTDVTSLLSVPVWIMEPFSVTQLLAEIMEYSDLLGKAAKCEDPLLRHAYVAAFLVSPYGAIERTYKPFNPILGETFEFAEEGKFSFFAEQVSHHPPVAAAYACNEGWTYSIVSAPKTKFLGNSVDVFTLGRTRINLTDHSETYSVSTPQVRASNIVVGVSWIDVFGSLEVHCVESGMKTELKFKQCGWFGSGRYQVEGFTLDKDDKKVMKLSGMWNSHLDMIKCDGEGAELANEDPIRLWTCAPKPKIDSYNFTDFAYKLNKVPDDALEPLKSDSRRRPDRAALAAGDSATAQEQKHILEERQRAEKRERTKRGEGWTPRWFEKVPLSEIEHFSWESTVDEVDHWRHKPAFFAEQAERVSVTNDEVEGKGFNPWQYPELPDGKAP